MDKMPIVIPKNNYMRMAIFGVPILGILCAGVCFALFGYSLITSISQRDDMAKTIDEFFKAMVAQDVDQASSLFSDRLNTQELFSNLQKSLDGTNFASYEDYVSLEIQNLSMGPVVNTNMNEPQGMRAHVEGTVTYSEGYLGTFQAVLGQENGKWKLFSINITVPPQKIEQYLKNSP